MEMTELFFVAMDALFKGKKISKTLCMFVSFF